MSGYLDITVTIISVVVGIGGLIAVILGVKTQTRVDLLEKTVSDQKEYIAFLEGARTRDAEIIAHQGAQLSQMGARMDVLESMQPGKQLLADVHDVIKEMTQTLDSHNKKAATHWAMEERLLGLLSERVEQNGKK